MKNVSKKVKEFYPFLVAIIFNLSVILAYGRAGGGGGHSSGGHSSGGSHTSSGSHSTSSGGSMDPVVAYVIIGIVAVVVIISLVMKYRKKK